MMKRDGQIAVILVITLLTSCTALQHSRDTPRYLVGGATSSMVAEVLPLIRGRTKGAIITVEKAPDGTLQVETGTLVPYRSGHGNWYKLKKIHGRWRIIDDGVWIV
jgi:hypothetical protein